MLPSPFQSRIAAAAVVLLISTVSVDAVWAQDRDVMSEIRLITPHNSRDDAGGRSSLSEAIRRVQRSTGGQILGAERIPFDGRDINRVKYMARSGRVRTQDDPAPDRAPARASRPPGNSSGFRGRRGGPPPRRGNNR